jgi:hypothetical protein
MSRDSNDLLLKPLTKPQKETLREQTIEPGSPGPILSNIQVLIEAIGEGMPTSSKYFALPQGQLTQLNEKLVTPLQHQLKRPRLRSFPTLMGLFLLLRTMGLAVSATKPRRVVMIDPGMLEQWKSLCPTEQYLNLLNNWLKNATWDIIGEEQSSYRSMSVDVGHMYLTLNLPVTETGANRAKFCYGTESDVILALLHQFGWVRLGYEPTPKEGKSAALRSAERLPLGDAMFAAIGESSWFLDVKQTSLESTFRPYFPAWKRALQPTENEFRESRYTLKLSWGKVWRRLVAPAETTLETVAQLLLKAFKFDHDHLYEFQFRDHFSRKVCVADPMIGDEDNYADEFRLGDLPLAERDTMTFLFDFGDSWEFTILIEEIDEDCKLKTKPKITAKSGTAPKQYDWD